MEFALREIQENSQKRSLRGGKNSDSKKIRRLPSNSVKQKQQQTINKAGQPNRQPLSGSKTTINKPLKKQPIAADVTAHTTQRTLHRTIDPINTQRYTDTSAVDDFPSPPLLLATKPANEQHTAAHNRTKNGKAMDSIMKSSIGSATGRLVLDTVALSKLPITTTTGANRVLQSRSTLAKHGSSILGNHGSTLGNRGFTLGNRGSTLGTNHDVLSMEMTSCATIAALQLRSKDNITSTKPAESVRVSDQVIIKNVNVDNVAPVNKDIFSKADNYTRGDTISLPSIPSIYSFREEEKSSDNTMYDEDQDHNTQIEYTLSQEDDDVSEVNSQLFNPPVCSTPKQDIASIETSTAANNQQPSIPEATPQHCNNVTPTEPLQVMSNGGSNTTTATATTDGKEIVKSVANQVKKDQQDSNAMHIKCASKAHKISCDDNRTKDKAVAVRTRSKASTSNKTNTKNLNIAEKLKKWRKSKGPHLSGEPGNKTNLRKLPSYAQDRAAVMGRRKGRVTLRTGPSKEHEAIPLCPLIGVGGCNRRSPAGTVQWDTIPNELDVAIRNGSKEIRKLVLNKDHYKERDIPLDPLIQC